MRFLCRFSHHNDYNAFRLEELEALACMQGLDPKLLWIYNSKPPSESEAPFVYIDLPSESHCSAIISRSILIKAFVEVWGEGESYEDVFRSVTEENMDKFRHHVNSEKSFAFKVSAFGKKLTSPEQIQRMSVFSPLFSKTDRVDIQSPNTTLVILEGLVSPGKVVLDPFVGTGSILIAASHFGAFCIGSDIDIRVLKGYSVAYQNPHLKHTDTRTDIFKNFESYGLRRPEILRCDNSAWVWRLCPRSESSEPTKSEAENFSRRPAYLDRLCVDGKPWADIVITDPPYGIRAGARQSGLAKPSKREPRTRSNEDRLTYIPPTIIYNSRAIVSDLLNLSARILVDQGRLVFLMPVAVESAREELSSIGHEDLTLEAASFQELSGGVARYLVTMRRNPRT